MFKNSEKSVCSTNSILIGPTPPKKVSVIYHSKSVENSKNPFSDRGTNSWLKNGGELPLVSVDPTPIMPTRPKHIKQVKWYATTKQTAKPQPRQLPTVITNSKANLCTQASLNPPNLKLETVCEKEKPLVVDKEGYMNIISHFNEQHYTDVYNPEEFSDIKNKRSTSSSLKAQRSQQEAATAPEKIHYSEEAKAAILQSIQEELRSWKSDGGSVDDLNI